MHDSSKSSSKISRRLLLKGAGTIAIALPFLEEFMPKARAEGDDGLPCRLFTLSFGLGIEEALQLQRFGGPLQPFEPFVDKAAFFTNVDGTPLEAGGTPHFRSAAATFTGVPQQDGEYHAGGPSMEQVMKRALHPSGVPNVAVPELSVGLWSRTGAVSQFTRHWNEDGSPGQRPERRPTRIFDLLFGSYEPPSGSTDPDPDAVVRNHVRRSVLDHVLEQYKDLTGPKSPLGTASKQRIDNHLSAIRDVETQLAPDPDGPGGPALSCMPEALEDVYDPEGHGFYDNASGPAGSGAPMVHWEVAEETMKLIGDIMAIGVSCDAIRFGSMLCVGGGGHIRFDGVYQAQFSDGQGGLQAESLDFGALFTSGTPHDRIFHAYDRDAIRVYQHFSIRQLTHMLARMDALVEPNGKSVLDNSLVLVGTEYGENHTATHTFHAVLGGGGRFNPGWYEQALLPSDIYHQALAAYGVDSGIPDRWGEYQPIEIAGFRNV